MIFQIKIGKSDITNQTHVKFLGVIIDDHLMWHEHCNTLYNVTWEQTIVAKHAKPSYVKPTKSVLCTHL